MLHCCWRRSRRQYVHGRVSPHSASRGLVAEGIENGPNSRVAICNFRGATLLECYVVPTMTVTDYRTSTTGITPAHLSSRKSTVAITLPTDSPALAKLLL